MTHKHYYSKGINMTPSEHLQRILNKKPKTICRRVYTIRAKSAVNGQIVVFDYDKDTFKEIFTLYKRDKTQSQWFNEFRIIRVCKEFSANTIRF